MRQVSQLFPLPELRCLGPNGPAILQTNWVSRTLERHSQRNRSTIRFRTHRSIAADRIRQGTNVIPAKYDFGGWRHSALTGCCGFVFRDRSCDACGLSWILRSEPFRVLVAMIGTQHPSHARCGVKNTRTRFQQSGQYTSNRTRPFEVLAASSLSWVIASGVETSESMLVVSRTDCCENHEQCKWN